MVRKRSLQWVALAAIGLLGSSAAGAAGLIVESVKPEEAAERSGLRPGDLLFSWRLDRIPPEPFAAASGALQTPYDLIPLRFEEAPRHPVVLIGLRGAEPREWPLSTSDWGLEARPSLPGAAETLFLEGQAAKQGGDLEAMERSWRAALASLVPPEDPALRAWLGERLGRALSAAGKVAAADAAFSEALAGVDRDAEPRLAAALLRAWGGALANTGPLDRAEARYREALELARRLAPKSLLEAITLTRLAIVVADQGNLEPAGDLLRQAHRLREELVPDSTEVAGSLNNLGILARRQGDFAAAERYLTQGAELLARVAPDSVDRGLFEQNLGNLAFSRGDYEQAESRLVAAVAVFERAAPDGENLGHVLSGLAETAMQRGDLARADVLLRRAFAALQRSGMDEVRLAMTLIDLGNLDSRRGDLEVAEADYRRALEIYERLSPDGPDTAVALGSLGVVEALQEKYTAARGHLERSLAIREKMSRRGLLVSTALEQLGRLEIDSGGDLARAEGLLRRSLAMMEEDATSRLYASYVEADLADLAARRGRTAEARSGWRRVVALRREVAPGSTDEAQALHSLGKLELRLGRRREGEARLCAAIDVLDRQRRRVGSTQAVKASFESLLGDYYTGCLEARLALGRSAEAFQVLERGRARSFLALLAGRDLRPADLPLELLAQQRRLDARGDKAQSRLAILVPGRDDTEIEGLIRELRQLDVEREEIASRVRRVAPRAAALEGPQPLGLAGARAALDPGTVLLEYAVGSERSWVFAVAPPGARGPALTVREIGLGRNGLAREVQDFRRRLEDSTSDPQALRAAARHLYGLLLRPVESRFAGAQRLLLSPDGPLHLLPFAALVRDDQYLAERRPLHSVLSATVYAELKRSRPRGAAPDKVAAFGDPFYPAASAPAAPDAAVGEAVRRGLRLTSLPATRTEVEGIAALFPGSQVYLGREATEERAKALGTDVGLVHFACHAYVDERFPLNSGLALSLPEKERPGDDNGLLQAWEIFERVRLRADLVTLSACDSGLGKEMGGEGLVGLVRAFQYAGARSVLASGWSVSDASTAELMQHFYRHLRDGNTKDEALRRAQIDLLRAPGAPRSHPFHWAAFQLFGDWR